MVVRVVGVDHLVIDARVMKRSMKMISFLQNAVDEVVEGVALEEEGGGTHINAKGTMNTTREATMMREATTTNMVAITTNMAATTMLMVTTMMVMEDSAGSVEEAEDAAVVGAGVVVAEAEGEDVVARQLKAMKAEAMRARLMLPMILERKMAVTETKLLKRLENIPPWERRRLGIRREPR